jgi:hypothetical protein
VTPARSAATVLSRRGWPSRSRPPRTPVAQARAMASCGECAAQWPRSIAGASIPAAAAYRANSAAAVNAGSRGEPGPLTCAVPSASGMPLRARGLRPYCVYADEAVRELTRQGFRARRLTDGFPDWKHAGLPTSTAADDGGASPDRSGTGPVWTTALSALEQGEALWPGQAERGGGELARSHVDVGLRCPAADGQPDRG